MIESITNYSYYIETYSKKKITISPSQNQNGAIETDDIGNKLSSAYFTLGDMEFGTLTKYDYGNSLLVYDSIGYDLYKKNNQIDMSIEWGNGTKYKIGAFVESSINYDDNDNKFYFRTLLGSGGASTTIFKAYINGYEVPSFDLVKDNSGYIKVVGNSREKLNFIPSRNQMDVVLYITDQTIVSSIELDYMSVDSIIDIDNMSTGGYFNNTFSKKYLNIRAMTDTSQNSLRSIKKRRQLKDRKLKTQKDNKLSMEMYMDTKYDTLYNTDTNSQFRVIAIGSFPNIIKIWNNCRFEQNFTTRYDKELIIASYNISYDYLEELLLDDGEKIFRVYNSGYYNEGIYG